MQQHGQSPRKRKLRLYFTYGVMTMTVVVISLICILLVLGYRFNFKSGDVQQGALLQFMSFPENASITLDNKVLSFQTPGKQNVDTGKHTVSMELSGYQIWRKSFSVKASELRWLNYARMVPTDIKTTSVKEFPSIVDSLPSPDRKWYMLHTTADTPTFTLADLRDDKKPVLSDFTLPATTYAQKEGATSTFSLVEWDFGARYVLIKHVLGDTTEYIRADRTDPTNTVDISTKLGVSLKDIHFSGTSGNVFYGLEQSGSIRKLDINAGTISQPVLENVTTFQLFKDSTMAYVLNSKDSKIGVGIIVNGKASRVQTYADDMPVFVDTNEYFNDSYMAIGRGNSIVVYKNPETTDRIKVATVSAPTTISWLRFNSSGRFVLAGSGSQYSTYDLETSEKYDVNLPGTAADPTKPLQWLDDFYLISSSDNSLRITEFDGSNQHVITSTVAGLPATLSDDGKFFYSIGRTQSGAYTLQSSAMTVTN